MARCLRFKRQALALLLLYIFLCSIINTQLVLAKQNVEQHTLEYDSAGNLVNGLSYSYEYDDFNLLKRIKDSAGRVIEEYWYNHEGDRVKKDHYNPDGSKETFYYIGKEFVRKVNSSGSTDTKYYYHGDSLVAKEEGNEILFFHQDHLGSTSLVTDSAGNTVEKTTYLPFGELNAGGTQETRLYTGKELDYTGLVYYGARYYSPSLMKFVQPDTLLPDIYDPQQLNRYAYARNNPYKYTDPSGNIAFIPLLIGAAILIFEAITVAVTTEWAATSMLLFDNIQNEGVAKGAGVTALQVSGGVVAGKAVWIGAGAALKGAKGTFSAVSRTLDDIFVSGKKMINSKSGDFKGFSIVSKKSSEAVSFSEKQLQQKFKHAPDFGIIGNYNKANAEIFKNNLKSHMTSKDTLAISGTYRGTIKGTHYFDPNTNKWVFVDNQANLVSAWKLSNEQRKSLLSSRRNVQ